LKEKKWLNDQQNLLTRFQNPVSCNLIGLSKAHLDTTHDRLTSDLNGRVS